MDATAARHDWGVVAPGHVVVLNGTSSAGKTSIALALQDALERAGSDAAEVGFAHARELIAASRGRAAGVYLVAPFRRPLRVLELLAD